jgi:beta-catenin-like protein 1
MASEADLDTEIKSLSILSEHPELYEEFAKMGCVGSLVSLLSHDNTDIAIDAIQIINELTDEDIQAEQEQWDSLVNALVRPDILCRCIPPALTMSTKQLDADVIELLAQNLSRLNEANEADRAGIYYIFSECRITLILRQQHQLTLLQTCWKT